MKILIFLIFSIFFDHLYQRTKYMRYMLNTDCSASQTVSSYFLRSGLKAKNIILKTKFSNLTFSHFFPRLLIIVKHIDLSFNKVSFQDNLGAYLESVLKIFIDKFPRFDVKYSNRCTKKKRLNCKNKPTKIVVKVDDV